MSVRSVQAGLGIALLLCPASPARAFQSVLQLQPVPAGAPLDLVVVDAAAPAPTPRLWPREELGWLFVREGGYQENHDRLETELVLAAPLHLERHTPGLALVGWDPPARREEVTGEGLFAFLEARRGTQELPAALARLAERPSLALVRHESLALQARGSQSTEGCAAIATSKTGQRVELRPLLDPAELGAGSDLPLRVYLPEGDFDCVLSQATQLTTGLHVPVELGAAGAAHVRLTEAGAWRIEAHALRLGETEEVELWTGTLVFELVGQRSAEIGGGR